MDIEYIKAKIEAYRSEKKKMFLTSSFQSQSVPLLHIISRIDNNIPIFFLNTGFLFPQTIRFKDQLASRFNLNVIGLESAIPKINQMDADNHFLYSSDPDYCCHINKVFPLEPILMQFDVWINGIRADQNENRKNMKLEQAGKYGTIRYHPILYWTKNDVEAYREKHQLPKHPLDAMGYDSIGCEPCTIQKISTHEREGRWAGLKKTECGLHTELAEESPKFVFNTLK